MSIKIEFLGPIDKESIFLDVSSLSELSNELKKDKDLIKWLDISAIAINDEIIKDLNYPLNKGDRVCLLPPVCGG
jgi:molybdopterin synthase sulfur carrier subunit